MTSDTESKEASLDGSELNRLVEKVILPRIASEMERVVKREMAEIVGRINAVIMDRLCDVNTHMRVEATRSTLEYIRPFFGEAILEADKRRVYDIALERMTIDGLVLEFGVYTGRSINYIATRLADSKSLSDKTVHGFDSFEGLPEDWLAEGGVFERKGTFSLKGELPVVESNVVLHKGWYADTLPDFSAARKDPVALIHLDSDLYSSTKYVLEILHDKIVPGSIMIFDNFFNYPGWQDGEFRAFKEASKERGWNYKYLAFNPRGRNRQQALLQIL